VALCCWIWLQPLFFHFPISSCYHLLLLLLLMMPALLLLALLLLAASLTCSQHSRVITLNWWMLQGLPWLSYSAASKH
jgi:hypothetical protein